MSCVRFFLLARRLPYPSYTHSPARVLKNGGHQVDHSLRGIFVFDDLHFTPTPPVHTHSSADQQQFPASQRDKRQQMKRRTRIQGRYCCCGKSTYYILSQLAVRAQRVGGAPGKFRKCTTPRSLNKSRPKIILCTGTYQLQHIPPHVARLRIRCVLETNHT